MTSKQNLPMARPTQAILEDPVVPRAEALLRVIALDGPAGTGKSSVARAVAARLGWRFVDTGATYRAATLAARRAGTDLQDLTAVEAVVAASCIQLVTDAGRPSILLDGQDVSGEIRTAEVTGAVSEVSAVPAVRRLMIAVQREAMGTHGSVVEGRDIATVVAPFAAVKVYLDARADVRAARRAAESSPDPAGASNLGPTHTQVVRAALSRRDGLDSQTNKLEVSDGAVHLDSSDLTLDQVVAEIIRLVEQELGSDG